MMLDTQTLIMYAYNQVNSEHCEANINQKYLYHIKEKLYTETSWGARLAGGPIALISK